MLQVKDLKALLAYTTLMVLGSIALLLGSGTEQAVFSALALLLAHAFYKAGMFMVAGSVDHARVPATPRCSAAYARLCHGPQAVHSWPV